MLFRDIPVAGMGILTVTVQVALLLEPSAVVAVMVAVPLATAVTTPALLTVATDVLLLVHVTLLLLALEGVTVAVRVDVWPADVKEREVLLRLMPVAWIGMFTVTLQVALLLEPSAVVAVIVAVPLATAVTTPELDTVATAVLLLVHVTFVLVALDGVTVAVRVDV